MNAAGLRRALALSVAAHAALFLFFSMAARNFKVTVPRDVYRVSLVSPGEAKRWQVREPPGRAAPSAPASPEKEAAGKTDFGKAREQAVARLYRSERLRALEEKRESEVYLRERKEEIEKAGRVKGIARSAAGRGVEAPAEDAGEPSASVLEAYIGKVQAGIRAVWVYADIDVKGRSAAVSVRIEKDGTIVVKKFEKPSGNRLFDSSLLKAIAKASPVEPPPFGADDYLLNFSPEEE